MTWQMGKIKSVSIKSNVGGNLRLRSNTPLKMADGTPLTIAEGDNSNTLTQPYIMPAAIVVDPAKIPSTSLPTTYLYDIPTDAGQTIELVSTDTPTAVKAVRASDGKAAAEALYSSSGYRVDNNYKGLAVKSGLKIMR